MTAHAIEWLAALGSRATWPSITGLLLQLTALGLVGHLGLLLARRGSAALRHLIAVTTLASMLVLPLSSAITTAWKPWHVATRLLPVAAEKTASWEPAASFHVTSTPSGWNEDDTGPVKATSTPSPIVSPKPRLRVEDLPAMLAAAALLIAALLLLRVALGLLAASRAVSQAGAGDARLQRELTAACRRLGITRRVRLATTSRLGIPVVTGFSRQTLVLPEGAMRWSDERLRAVLLHELAHVRRGDARSLMLGRLTTALFWFHPLVWTLARVMHRECERACDDVVLASGLKPSDYADHLLSIARAAAGRRLPGLTLAFARPSSLEGRLLGVLRSDLRRGPASARVRALVTLLALVLVLPLSAIQVVGAVRESWKKETKHDTWKQESRKQEKSWKQEKNKLESSSTDVAVERGDPVADLGEPPVDTEAPTAVVARTQSPGDLFQRARELYQGERYREAGPVYEEAARAGYRPEVSWYNAACSYALDSQKLRALGALQKAIDEGYDDAAHIQGDDDLDSIRGDSRFQLMMEGLRRSPSGQRQRDGAVRKYENLRNADSDDASSWNSAGIELMRSGETELAIKAFQRRVAIDGSPSGIYNEACAEALGGQTDAALSALERSIVAGFSGGKDKLREDADLASLRGSRRFEGLVQLASDLTIEHANGDDRHEELWREQLPRYERTAQQHAGLGRAWFNLGYVQLRAGDAASGRESFKRALDQDYRRPTTLYNLACCCAQAGDRDAAIRYLEQSETAGMNLWNSMNDDDLRPLRSDPRFRAIQSRLERNLLRGKFKEKSDKGS